VPEVPSWAAAAPEQIGAARKAGAPVAFENSIGMRFVLVPAGRFTMGSAETEEGHGAEEFLHEVTLTKPYYMGVTEVTNLDFAAFRPDHSSGSAGKWMWLGAEQQPVAQVSWDDATAFADWLTAREARITYRLPTEAEWEYACRAGTTTPFWWGRSISARQACYNAFYGYGDGITGRLRGRGQTVFVGSLPANRWGLREVHGNLDEWCMDWYGDYPPGSATDPVGPATGGFRVIRGGCFDSPPSRIRAACRGGMRQGSHSAQVGFRLAASLRTR
jgi:formylglycine-generating enzyme required for sulfatase activity